MSTWWKAAIGALGLAFVVLLVLYAVDSGSEDASSFQPAFPDGGPVEFLYLDAARVATYLAQVEGGKVESEKLSRKLTQSLNTGIDVKGTGQVSATRASELAAERTLKPTAASSFFALRTRLEEADVIETIRLRYFPKDVEGLKEGRFVSFETSALLSPIYLNAYLAVLHAGSVAAIFPNSEKRQKEARAFLKSVGPSARAAFALQPFELDSKGVASADSDESLERKNVVYLLPVTAPLLSEERSLLKYGGGRFTVLGKLVRRFPEPTTVGTHENAYVDSATQETWEQALRDAPGELLCRTEPECAAELRKMKREGELTSAARIAEIKNTRQAILKKLDEQTSITDRGGVILPIAIYK